MVGSTRHWLPLVGGFTGYEPPHWPVVAAAVSRLPASEALDDLVDLTHVRWILACRRTGWPDVAGGVAALPGVTSVFERDGCRLLRVDRVPRRPAWFAAIARGPRPGETPLGTPLAPLAPGAARAKVALASSLPPTLGSGTKFPVDLRVTNAGSAAWPVVVARRAPDTHTVHLLVRWWRAGDAHDDAHVAQRQRLALPYDVEPGATVRVLAWLEVPEIPGRYTLETAVRQVDGALLDGDGQSLEQEIVVQVAGPWAALSRSFARAP
jgi:hypothetical protein